MDRYRQVTLNAWTKGQCVEIFMLLFSLRRKKKQINENVTIKVSLYITENNIKNEHACNKIGRDKAQNQPKFWFFNIFLQIEIDCLLNWLPLRLVILINLC